MKRQFLLVLFAWSLLPCGATIAALPTIRDKESTAAEEKSTVAEKPNTSSSKPVAIVNNPTAPIEKNSSKQESAYWPPIWSNWALVLVALGASLIAVRTLSAIDRQANIAERTLALSHRPRIKAQVFGLTNKIFDEQRVALRYEVVNFGGTDATITDSNCTILLRHVNDVPKLPMLPPYDSDATHQIVTAGSILRAGETQHFSQAQYVPDDKDIDFCAGNMTVYVIGYLSYRGNVGPQYRTAFCRRLQTDRFTPTGFAVVTDPNYEYET